MTGNLKEMVKERMKQQRKKESDRKKIKHLLSRIGNKGKKNISEVREK